MEILVSTQISYRNFMKDWKKKENHDLNKINNRKEVGKVEEWGRKVEESGYFKIENVQLIQLTCFLWEGVIST